MIGIAEITSRGQTTIPHEIRAALRVGPGDFLSWEVGPDGVVRVRRVQALDLEYLRAVEITLDEWSGAADEAAYREL